MTSSPLRNEFLCRLYSEKKMYLPEIVVLCTDCYKPISQPHFSSDLYIRDVKGRAWASGNLLKPVAQKELVSSASGY